MSDGGWRPTVITRQAGGAAPVRAERRADSIYNPFTGLGGLGDKGQAGRPSPYHIPLSDSELELLYQYGGIARRLVDIVPGRACRRGWAVPEIGSEDSRLQVWRRVEEAMVWARLYGGALLLMVTEDDVTAGVGATDWLAQPIDLERVGRVESLQVFDAVECWPASWDTDVRSPTFRLPSSWGISCDGWRGTVHASRVVHFRGARRQPSRYRSGRTRMPDDSVLQAIWDDLRKLAETLQGGAILAHEIRESVLKIGDYASLSTGDEAAELAARIRLMSQGKSMLGINIIGPTDDYQNRSNPPTGFDQLSAAAWEALAAVTGIPQVILMGSTPGGLNTDGASSWEGFRQLVSTYQEQHRHDLERLYRVIYAAQDGPTGGEEPEGWSITFAALDEPDESTIAATRQTIADTDAALIGAGVYTAEEVRRGRYGVGGWSIDLPPLDPSPPQPVAGSTGLEEATIQDPGEIPAAPAEQVPEGYGAVRTYVRRLPQRLQQDAAPAGGSVVILVPAADPGLRAQVEAVVGPLVAETEPHITVLYLGSGLTPEAVAEVAQVLREEAQVVEPVRRAAVGTFPGGDDGVPVVVEFGDAWGLAALHDRLLVRLAHLVTARQHRTYRPHLTIGYAAEVSVEAATALLALDVSELAVPVLTLEVRRGAEVVASVAVG